MTLEQLQAALGAFNASTRFISEHTGDVTESDLEHMNTTVREAAHKLLGDEY